MGEPRPEWGHRIFDPDGRPIQLPYRAVERLRRLGVLLKNRNLGGLQIDPVIHTLLTPEYDAITMELRRVLGTELEGPKWLVCNCRRCRWNRNESRAAMKEHLFDFQADLHRQGSAQ